MYHKDNEQQLFDLKYEYEGEVFKQMFYEQQYEREKVGIIVNLAICTFMVLFYMITINEMLKGSSEHAWAFGFVLKPIVLVIGIPIIFILIKNAFKCFLHGKSNFAKSLAKRHGFPSITLEKLMRDQNIINLRKRIDTLEKLVEQEKIERLERIKEQEW